MNIRLYIICTDTHIVKALCVLLQVCVQSVRTLVDMGFKLNIVHTLCTTCARSGPIIMHTIVCAQNVGGKIPSDRWRQ